MDLSKFNGILDAIEAETKAAAPSHINLARLTRMAFLELLHVLFPMMLQAGNGSETFSEPAQTVQVELNGIALHQQEDNK